MNRKRLVPLFVLGLSMIFVSRLSVAVGLGDLSYEEQSVVSVIKLMEQGEVDNAIDDVRQLLEHKPKFRLAHLLYADLLSMKLGRATPGLDKFINGYSDQIKDLREEAQVRYMHQQHFPMSRQIPSSLLKVSDTHSRIIVVDIKTYRLYLFEHINGDIQIVKDHYVSTGKQGALKQVEGDQRTPLGVYYVTASIDDKKLPDFYGSGAFPINYPNAWDKRLKRTGYGIWLHGVPKDTYSRAPKASDGCIALTNEDLEALWPEIQIGNTPVIIVDGVQWSSEEQLSQERKVFQDKIEQWRLDWQSLEHESYIRHYSSAFYSSGRDYDGWERHKKNVNASKSYIDVQLEDVSIYAYPSEENLMLVTFRQSYRSSNYKNTSDKQQFWRLEEDGQWRILYEGKPG